VTEKAEMPASKMDAPSGLDLNPRPPRSVRVSKRAAGTVMAIAAIILGLFAYGGYKRQQRQIATMADGSLPHNVLPATAAGAEIAKEVSLRANPQQPAGLAAPGFLQPPGDAELQGGQVPSGGQVFVRQTSMPVQPPVAQIPQPREPSPEERRLLAAYEREQQAIAAPTTLRDSFGAPTAGSGPQATPASRGAGDDANQIASLVQALTRQNGGSQVTPEAVRALLTQRSQSADGGMESESDGQSAKEAFLAKARAGQADDYLKSTRTSPLSRYEIKAGWEIPAVLEQALNSDLPGELKALVSSNVYDTASGRYLLIPQGSRLVGVYNSRIGYGQDGVQVIWDRVIYPDGSSLDLSGMIGQDAHGFSGFRDKVDRHYTGLIGFAVLTSLFAAASEIAQNQNRSVLTYPSPAQVAGSAAGQQSSDLGAQITRRNLNVQPTIKVAVGYRFNVRVNRDILFDTPYSSLAGGR
jgi:type IV secretion system protein VirB10